MTKFTKDDMRVIRAIKEARDLPAEPFDVEPSLIQAARQYAGLKAFFENVQLSHYPPPPDEGESRVSCDYSIEPRRGR